MVRWQIFGRAFLLQRLILWFYIRKQLHSFCLLGLVTIILKIFKLCLCSSKMNNLSSSLYLHLEPLLRAMWSWHSKGWTKQLSGLHSSPGSCSVLGMAATEPPESPLHKWHTSGLANTTMGTEVTQTLTLQTPYNYRPGRFSQTG